MTLLTIVQDAMGVIGAVMNAPTAITSVVSNPDPTIAQALAIAQTSGREVAKMRPWTKLQVEHTFTLSDGVANYAMPSDFDRFIDETWWDRNNYWPLQGPYTPQEWQVRKSGIISDGPRKRFRLKGSGSTPLFIDPTPGVWR